jgi:hypothetical protein
MFSPESFRGFDFSDGFEPGVTGANLGGVGWQTGGNDEDADFGGNGPCANIKNHPFPGSFGKEE